MSEQQSPASKGLHYFLNGKAYVGYIDHMGTDADICAAARVSYGEGTRSVSDDRTLIRYLMRHRHTTPLEMVEIKMIVQVPMDMWRQCIRHRTASVNEYSTRYSEAIDEAAITLPDQWRTQSTSNKQGSGGFLPQGGWLSEREKQFHREARRIYEERLEYGVAREQARKDLPLSTMTRAYWKFDLHNLLHFLALRMDSHAQAEIRELANIIGHEIVKPLFPLVWEAFVDYRLNAMTLTGLDIQAVLTGSVEHILNKRERTECLEKLERLGISINTEET